VFSGGMTEAQRLAGVDKRRQEVLQDACMLEERARKQKDPEKAQMLARLALWHKGTTRIVDFDPKQGGALLQQNLLCRPRNIRPRRGV
jgi:hypothetical protein